MAQRLTGASYTLVFIKIKLISKHLRGILKGFF